MMASNNQSGGNKGNNQSGDTSKRGFASMDPDKQREIASEGGKASHATGNAHEFSPEEARRAGSQSHGSGGSSQSDQSTNSGNSSRGGTPEQHAKAGSQSHKNDDNGNQQSGSNTRGGSSEQHAKAGSQSHKNDK